MTLVDVENEITIIITSNTLGNFNKQLRVIKDNYTIINSGYSDRILEDKGELYWALIKFKKPSI